MMISSLEAQTVLSGDHVVEGDLEIGTDTQKGGLTIKGETGNTANLGIRVTGDGGVVFEGSIGQGPMPQIAMGKPTMMWYAGKRAFWLGVPSSSMWDEEFIGEGSVNFGYGLAYGTSSVAMGYADATGPYGVGMGSGDAGGDFSVAMSGGVANGSYSTAMSGGATSGRDSTAMSGGYAMGKESVAIGPVMAFGFRSVVVGSFNRITEYPSEVSWIETDPIFVVGNGTGELTDPPELRDRDAFIIRKNGNVEMNGDVEMMAKVKMPRQGDILMGEFGNLEP